MAGAAEIDYGEIREITQKSKNKQYPLPFLQQPKELNKQSSFKSVPGEAIKPPGPASLHKVVSCGDTHKETDVMVDEDDEDKRKQFELIIQQYDGPQNSFYSVKEEGAKIGRHSTNQILILDESISRFHAEIKFNDGKFYIKDTGSTTGTFIKVIEKIQILPVTIL